MRHNEISESVYSPIVVKNDTIRQTINVGDYFVTLILDSSGRFKGVSEIGVKKEFLNYEQRMAKKDFDDIEHLFLEEE